VGVRQVLLWLLPQKVRFKFKLEAYVVLRSTESHAVLSLLGVFGSRYFQFTFIDALRMRVQERCGILILNVQVQ